ncbi:hypothetical protein PPL_02148 [Heterostelium album PN500]|uniref:Autophagy-related protein 13 N-terminal domain-containing protein n=1 Tax=Heterostelium pallidum (strain ATCC 26659 / Pp 5 / PN500) TaxID=670386 RepID=D3B1H5_HETP5|nr:hypothetical protein PPL_02148 [Heterostelium album PN500]EFA85149.1 hypothetical protein PPL_02148 [Heterostelium album PN500]|eukprot:XP_020437258.1 hypothetical protein PPL_02148 [Heterostelium album PN500]
MDIQNANVLRDKTDELMRRSISKIVQCILSSRVELLQQFKKINKHFHIETEDSEQVQKQIDKNIFARNGIRTLFVLEIHFDEGGELLGINTLVESWRFVFEPFKDVDTSFELPKLYRNVILLVRTLYSFLRNIPCYSVYKNFTRNRSSTSKLKYQFRICDFNSILSPSFSLSIPTKSFTFTSIPTPLGVLKLDVNYREDLSKEISISSQLGLDSQFIIKDYNNNHFKSTEPQPIQSQQQQLQQQQQQKSYYYGGSYGSNSNSNNPNIPAPSQSLPIKQQQTAQQQQQQPIYYPQSYGSGGGGSGGRNMSSNQLVSSDPYKPSSVGSSDSYDYYGGTNTVGSGGGLGSYNNSFAHQYLQQQQQQQDKQTNPIGIPGTNSNNNNTNIYGSSSSNKRNNNSPGGVNLVSSPQTSTSPPFFVNANNSASPFPKPSGAGGSSPPFSSGGGTSLLHQQMQQQQQQQQSQPSYPLTVRQVTPSSGTTNISPGQHRHRSISAPITIHQQQYQQLQQQQQQQQQLQTQSNSYRSGRSPPMNIHTGFSPPNYSGTSPPLYNYTNPLLNNNNSNNNNNTNYGSYGSQQNQVSSGGAGININLNSYSNSSSNNNSGVNNNSNNNNQTTTSSSSSFKNSINSKLSQIHGPLLLTDVHKELQVKNTIEPLTTQSAIDTEEPVFASAVSSSSKVNDSDVGEFVRLCKIAPPLKLFDTNYTTESPIKLDQDVLELSKIANNNTK